MLCYIILCYVMLCYVILYYIILYYVVLCYVILYYIIISFLGTEMRCISVESELFMILSRILSDFAYSNGLPLLGIALLQLAASITEHSTSSN